MISKNSKINSIFRQFLYSDRLKFSEIERKTGIRSNELAYLLKRMIKEEVLVKNDDYYMLTAEYEKKIPHFAEESETTPLPVVLAACVKDNKILLIKRGKKAYKDYWSLPGGRIRTGETIKEATLRILKEKTFVSGAFVSTNAVLHEQYEGKAGVKNAFILFMTRAEPVSGIKEKEDVMYFPLDELKNISIIPSDLWLIEKKLNQKMDLEEEMLEEKSGVLSMKMLD